MKKVLSLILSATVVVCLAGCDNIPGITSSSSSDSSSKNSSSFKSNSTPESVPKSTPESIPVSIPESELESSPEGTVNKTAAILQYINTDLVPAAEIEKKMLASYMSVTGDNYKTDAAMLVEFNTKTLPLARQLNKEAVEVTAKISDPEILAIHEKYITYTTKIIDTLTQMISAVKNQNAATMTAANKTLDEANASVVEYKNEITALANKNGVTIGGQE